MSNTTATVMVKGFQAVVSNRHGKFYASFVLMGDDAPHVAIMGPYKTQREAQNMADKGTRANQQRMDAGQPLQFVDMPTVPADVRIYITECLTAMSKQIGPEDVGVVFGKHMQ